MSSGEGNPAPAPPPSETRVAPHNQPAPAEAPAPVDSPIIQSDRVENPAVVSDSAEEVAHIPEKKLDAVTKELGVIARSTVASSISEIPKEDQSEAEQKIIELDQIRKIPSGDKRTNEDTDGISCADGNPVLVSINGEKKKVLFIEEVDDENFICKIDGIANSQKISRSAFFDAQLVSEQVAILSLFPDGPVKQALELYIKTLEQGDEALGDTASVDKVILDSAEELNLPIATPIRKFLELRRNALKLDVQMDGLEKQLQIEWLDALDDSLDGKVLADDAVIDALTMKRDIKDRLPKLEDDIANLKRAVDEGWAKPGDQERLYRLMMLKDAREIAEKAISEHNFTGSLIEKMQNGTASDEEVTGFYKALETGDLDKVINSIWQPNDKFKEWLSDEIKKKRLKGGSFFALAVLVMASMQVGSFAPDIESKQ